MEAFIRVNLNISGTAVDWIKDKKDAISVCHTSFLAQGGYSMKRHYILDKCDEKTINFFKIYGEVTVLDSGVKRDTITEMFKIAKEKATDEKLLFLEDDYLWRDDFRFETLEKALDEFKAVSPYDHPSHYNGYTSHRIVNNNGTLYRQSANTTHTFAVRRDAFLEHFDEFNYGLHDWIMWGKLAQVGVPLFTPIYGFATHLAKDLIALGYDYKNLYDVMLENIRQTERIGQ